jgi:beta-mannosidase
MEKTSSSSEINLHGQWRIASADGKHKADYKVPGDVHSSLIAAGIIPDPYIGRNEYDVRWVAEADWIASREFEWTGEGQWHLDVDYLDTVAEIKINNKSVLKADNCFRRYQPDVSKALKRGKNKIEIHFFSNVKEAAKRQKAHPYFVPYSNTNSPIPDTNFLRKPSCHAGWDWNLAIMPFGAYGRCKLVQEKPDLNCNGISLRQTHLADGKVRLNCTAYIHNCIADETYHLRVSLGSVEQVVKCKPTSEWDHAEFIFEIAKPKLWWPAGAGEQHLYELKVECGRHTETRRIGLRQIELINEKDEVGARFAFRMNGKEIFSRGANWIPADALPSRATPELTRKLLQAAVDANMNMIRIWGGGYYEQDWFYDICDELGLMVWQDFQFACNLYPADEKYLREVKREVWDQKARLHHHACIALWCGDNELIGALNWFPESRANRDRYLAAYDRLNHTIEQAAKGGTTAVENWWPSSPSPGLLSFGDAWHDDRAGDMHFWSVWHEGKDFEHYRDVSPRFCSEFGFQSYPSLHVIKQFATSEEDLNIASEVMESHQKNKGGNARIAETMFRYFRFPKDFGNFVYISQIQQGLAMKTAIEHWRSLKPHCMGTLYWQLNDTWPVASWSSLDHGGHWKAMHYMAKRFYAPVAVMAIPDKHGGTTIKAVNDRLKAQKLTLELIIFDPAGKAQKLKSFTKTIPADKAVEIARLKKVDMPKGHVLIMDYQCADGSKGRVHHAAEPYKALRFLDPQITHKAEIKNGKLHISLSVKHLSLFTTAEAGVDGSYSDNVLDLLPNEKAEIIFTPTNLNDLNAAQSNLIIRNLYSSSH